MACFTVHTRQSAFHDITAEVAEVVRSSGVSNGLVHVFVRHTTAAITINENADPDVCSDLIMALDLTFPDRPAFRHAEGNSAAHLKSSLIGPSELVPVKDGKLSLGTWQGIYLCEFDGPRRRTVELTIIAS